MSRNASVGRLQPQEAAAITLRTARLSVAVACVLILAKGWAWSVSGSVAMMASLADSALDLAASLFTLWAVRRAAEPPDDEHRYGHGKTEGFAALFQAMLVGASAALIAAEAIDRLRDPQPVAATGLAIAVTVLSIVLTALLVIAQTRAVAQTGSVATAGDRAHYLTDFASNAAVLVGLAVAAWLQLPLFDPLVGLGVAAWLAWGAVGVMRTAADELMDHELPEAARDRIRQLAENDDAPINVHLLRTRAAGPIIHIQFHLELPAELSLARAHELMVACETRILAEFPGADILIHPDPRGLAEPHGGDFFRERLGGEG